MAVRAMKPIITIHCIINEAFNMPEPIFRCAGVVLLLAARLAPFPVRTSMMMSMPTKVDTTRPGWMGERYGT